MKIFPYIELQGRTLLRPAYAKGELAELGSKLSKKFEKAYVIDLDGVEKNKPQLDVVQELCDEIPVLYEGGVRFAANVIDMLITGAEKAVVGSATLVSLEDLRRAFKLSDNIIFKVDFRDGILSFDRKIADRAFPPLARDLTEIGVRDILVSRELADEALKAKEELGFSLGVFVPAAERARYESLGVDYIVAGDYGRLVGDD